jgi:DNA modification methylase
MNKKIKSEKGNHKYLEIFYNIIESNNNDDKKNTLNKAAFSTELITKLIRMYGFEGDIIYDSFMGTGTSAVSALMNNCYYIGSEISFDQCEYAKNRINEYIKK